MQVRYTSFWKGRSGLEQVLLVAVGLLLVLSCCCALALALAQQPHCTNTNIRMLHPDHPAHCGGGDTSSPAPNPAPSPAPAPVCLETECVTVAAGIIQAADFSADPCEDFYQVAIHLHLSTLSIPAVSTSSTRAGAGWTPTPSRTASPAGTPSRNSGRIIRTHSGKRH